MKNKKKLALILYVKCMFQIFNFAFSRLLNFKILNITLQKHGNLPKFNIITILINFKYTLFKPLKNNFETSYICNIN